MINVTLGEVKTQENGYPKLMISGTGAIWLMESYNKGFYLFGGNGDFKDDRIRHTNVSNDFTDYSDPITIQNA
jgi:hypothetical protein